MAESILLSQAAGVTTITLNRPDKLNAFDEAMHERLAEALERVAADRGARVLVITGAGRAFCAGGDVHRMADLRQRGVGFDELRPVLEKACALITQLASLPLPTIAAVNGPAAGAGLGLALACDLRLASDQATFAEAHARIGLHAGWGGTYFLPRLVGPAKALELCWTTEVLDAAEALRIGLVNRVIAHDAFPEAVARLAEGLAAAPQTTVRLAKRTLGARPQGSLSQCLDAEIEALARCWASPDSAEGLAAFVAGRTPAFSAVAEPLDAPPPAAARHFE